MVENSREKLLAAASRLFAERGRDAVSTKEIAIAAGVSETHLFRLFKSKNRLYEEVVESVVGKGFSNIAGYGLDQIDFRKAIRSFANQMYDYLASHPEVVRLVFFSSLTDTKLTRKVFEPKAQILTDALARRIEQAQKAGLVRTDESSIALARALIAAVMYPYVSHALLQVGQIFKSEDNYRTNIEVWLDGIFTT
jgi:AcrR family transcriptional regulator